jgi:hypothetical protein
MILIDIHAFYILFKPETHQKLLKNLEYYDALPFLVIKSVKDTVKDQISLSWVRA